MVTTNITIEPSRITIIAENNKTSLRDETIKIIPFVIFILLLLAIGYITGNLKFSLPNTKTNEDTPSMVTTNITIEPSRITIIAEGENVEGNIPSYHQAILGITRDLYKLVETKTAQEFLQDNPVELEFENFTLIVGKKKEA